MAFMLSYVCLSLSLIKYFRMDKVQLTWGTFRHKKI